MNKTFKLIYNRVRGCVMVVNELTSACQTGKKAAATVAVAAALLTSGTAVAANTPWFDETEDIVYTTSMPLKPSTTEVSTPLNEVFEASPASNNVTHYALLGEWGGSDITVNNTTAALTVTDQVKEEGETTTPITASVISVEGIVANLTGDSVKLSVDNQTTQGSARFVKSAAALVSEFEGGGTLNVSATESQFDAETVSGSLAGISLEYGGTLNMTGNVVNINAQSSVSEQPIVWDEWDSRYRVSGLQFDGANAVKTSDNTALNISVTGTGETEYAADVFGIEGEHDGGEVYFGGATTVVTQSNAGSNVGIYLATVSEDESDEFGPSNVIFNGKTTVETTAQGAEYAIGLSVGLSDEAVEDLPDEELLGGADSLLNQVTFNNDLDITVSNGTEDAIGIYVGFKYDTEGDPLHILTVDGATTVTVTGGQDALGLEFDGRTDVTFNNDLTVQATLDFDPNNIQADYWNPDDPEFEETFGAVGFDVDTGSQATFLGNVNITSTVKGNLETKPESVVMEAVGFSIGDDAQATIGSADKTITVNVSAIDTPNSLVLGVGGDAFDSASITGSALEIDAFAEDGQSYGMALEGLRADGSIGSFAVNAVTSIESTTQGQYSAVGILSRDTDLTFNENVDIETNAAFGAWSRGVRIQGSNGDVTFNKDLTIDVNVASSTTEVAPREEDRGWGTGARGIHHQASTHLAIDGDLTIDVEGPTGVRGIDADAGTMNIAGNTNINVQRLAQFEPEEKDAFAIDVSDSSITIGKDNAKTTDHAWNVNGYNGRAFGLNATNAEVEFENSASTEIVVQSDIEAYGIAMDGNSSLVLTGNVDIQADTNGDIAEHDLQQAMGIRAIYGSELSLSGDVINLSVSGFGDSESIDLNTSANIPNSYIHALHLAGAYATIGDAGSQINLSAMADGGYARGMRIISGSTEINGKSLNVNAMATNGVARAIDVKWSDDSVRDGTLTINAPIVASAYSTGGFTSEGLRVQGVNALFTEDAVFNVTNELGGFARGVRIHKEGGSIKFEKDLAVNVTVGSSEEGSPESRWGSQASTGIQLQSVDKDMTVEGDLTITAEGAEVVDGIRMRDGTMSALSNTTIVVNQVNTIGDYQALGIDLQNSENYHELVLGSADKSGEIVDISVKSLSTIDDAGYAVGGIVMGNNSSLIVNADQLLIDAQAKSNKQAIGIGSHIGEDNTTISANATINAETDITVVSESVSYGVDVEYGAQIQFNNDLTINSQTNGSIADYPYQEAYGIYTNWGSELTMNNTNGQLKVYAYSFGDNSGIDLSPDGSNFSTAQASALAVGGSIVSIGADGFRTNLRAESVGGRATGIQLWAGDTTISGEELNVEAVAFNGIARAFVMNWPDSENRAYSLTVNAPTTILAHSTGGFTSEGMRVSGIDTTFNENVDMTVSTGLGGYANGVRIRDEGANVTFEKNLNLNVAVGSVANGMPVSEWGGHNGNGLRIQSVDKELTVKGDLTLSVTAPENAYGIRAQAGTVNALSDTTINVEQVNALDNASAYGVFVDNASIQIGQDGGENASVHHWTVDGGSLGNGTAYGVHAKNAAQVTIDEAELYINVQNGSDEAVGIYVDETSKVNFNWGLLSVKADQALKLEGQLETYDSDIEIEGSIALGQNALLTIGQDDELKITGNVNSTIAGTIGTTTYSLEPDKNPVFPAGGELVFAGGEMTLTETAQITANTLTLSDIVVHNRGEVEIADSIHLGSGTIWNEYDGADCDASTIYLAEGSEYISSDTDDYSTTLVLVSDQSFSLYLQGGQLSFIGTDGVKTSINGIEAGNANSAIFIENAYDYALAKVSNDTAKMVVQGEKANLTIDRLEVTAGQFAVLDDGHVTADELDLQKGITVADGGVLTTFTDQIFTIGLNAEGSNTDAGELTTNGQMITVTGGTVVFNDAFYNYDYATSARDVFNQGDVLVFNGQIYVPTIDPGVPEGSLAYREVADDANTIMAGVDVYMGLDTVVDDVATVDKSFGSASITVMPTIDSLVINEEEKLTLVGGGDKELVGFDVEADVTPTVTVKGDLQVGQVGAAGTSGSMSATLNIAGTDASLTVTEGNYSFGDLSVTQGLVDIDETGKANFNDVAVHANGQLNVDGTLTVDNLDVKLGSLTNANTLVVNNNMTIVSGDVENATNAQLTVGNEFEFTGGTFTNHGELNTNVALIDGTFVDDAIYNNAGTWTTDSLDIIAGQLSNTGTLTLTGDMNVDGIVTNAASKQMTVAGDLNFTGGTFNNEGNLSAKDVTVDAETTTNVLTNAGKLTASNVTLEGGKLSNTGDMEIADELAVMGGVFENADDLTVGSDLVVDGGAMSNSGVTTVTNALVVGVGSSLTNTNEMSADSVELDGDLINEGALNVTNNVTAWGATLENYDSLTADNLVLTDTEFVNAGSVNVADTVVLGAGSTWSQLDGAQLNAQTAYWKDGSKFMTNGTNELAFAGRTDYLQGGEFVHQDATGNQVQITDLVIKDGANTFVEAEYAFKNVNVEKNSSLTVRSDDGHLDSDSVTVAGNLNVTDGGLVTTTQLSNSGSMTIGNGGQVIADEVNFTGSVTLNTNGLLETYTDQIFTTGLNAYGSNADPHDLTTSGSNIVFNGGTLAFNDAYYNLVYAQNAGKLFGDGNKLVFNGQLYTGPVTGDNVIHYDDLEDNASLILAAVDVLITNKTGNSEFVTGKDFGVSSIILDQGIGQLTIGSDSEVTLVGGADKELINFADNVASNLVKVEGTLTVGYEGATDNSGHLDANLEVNGANAQLNVNLGQYGFADIDSFGGHITVSDVTMSAGDVMLEGGSLTVESSQVTFDNLETSAQVVNEGTINIKDQLVVDGGTLTNNDLLSVGNNTSIAAGATFTNNQTFTSEMMDVIGTFANAGTTEVTDLTVVGTLVNGDTLTVANKTTVTESGEFTNNQTFTSKVMDVIGTFLNAGTAQIATDLTVDGALENEATLTVANKTTVSHGGNLTNLQSFSSKEMEVIGTFGNAGTAEIETDLTVAGAFNNGHTTTVGNKTTIADGGTFTNHLSLTSKVMDVFGTFQSVGATEIATDLMVDGTIQNDGTLTVGNKTTVGSNGAFTNNQTFVSKMMDVIGTFTNKGTVEADDLTVTGTLENNDTLAATIAVANKTTVAQGGNIENLQSFSSKVMEVFGAFGNAGSAEIEMDLTVAGTFNNGNTTTVGNNTTIAASGTVTNHLSFTSKTMDVFGKYMSVGTTEIETDLMVEGTIQNDGTLTVANKTTVGQSGEFTNSQMFTSDVLNIAGTFVSGASATTNVANLAMQGVRIDNAGAMSVSDSMVVNRGLVNNADEASMTVEGQLLNLGGEIVNDGTLTTLGDAAFGTIESGVGYAQSGGSITNNGTWTASDIATTSGTITNNSDLTANSMTLIDTTFSNADDMTLTGSFAAYASIVTNTGTIETGHTNIHRDSVVTNDEAWNADKFSVNAGQFTNNDVLTVDRDLSIHSGTFTNLGSMTTGDATISGNKNKLSNVTLGGSWNASTLEVKDANVSNSGNLNVAGTFELGKGATWRDLGNQRVQASKFVWGEGSTYYMSASSTNGTLSIVGETHEFMGGRVAGLNGESEVSFTDFAIGSQAQVKLGGEYSFNSLEVTGGSLELVKNGSLDVTSLVNNGTITIGNGGQLTATTLDLDGTLTLNRKGTLATFSDQIFTTALNETGSNTDPSDLTAQADKITFNGGSLAINDANYNLVYAQNAADLMGALNGESVRLVFNGTLNLNPDEAMNPDTPVDIGLIGDSPNLVLSDLDVQVQTYGSETEATIDKSVGVSSVTVTDGVNKVNLEAGNTLTLVGGTGQDGQTKELISFASNAPEGQQQEVAVSGTLQIGDSAASADYNSGQISAKVTVGQDAAMNVGHGDYQFKDIAADGGSIVVTQSSTKFDNVELQAGSTMALGSGTHSIENIKAQDSTIQVTDGEANFGVVTLHHGSAIDVAETDGGAQQAQAKVEELHVAVAEKDQATITGTLTVDKLTGDETAVLVIGTTGEDGKRGDLTLGEYSQLNGMTLFLDPVWKDGQTIADASRLIYQSSNVDGKIVVGQNSYVVLGGDEDEEFRSVFKSNLTWGKDTLAAAYVPNAITIDSTTGALYVDGSLTSPTTPAAGSVTFVGNSVLVANVTNLTTGALITADSFSIDDASKAVIVGTLDSSKTYQLTNKEAWGADQLMAGNALWKLNVNNDGTFTAQLQQADNVFGDLMQGSDLANGGMNGTDAEKEYVDNLLTDTSGNTSVKPSVAARFDAAMNPAGALATFATAYDRANDFRQVVRDESATTNGSRLWARVTGSDNSFSDLTTGAQAIDVDTSAYGLVIGGEAAFDGMAIGMALTAGSGDSENSAVVAKDDFNYYGVSVYGKTAIGSVKVLADASVAIVKSDMTVGGVANVEAETDTTVFSMGIQAQKTFEFQSMNVTPFIGMDLYHVRADGYTNGHGATVDSASATAVEMPIGVTIAKGFETAGGMKVDPSFTFAVIPTLGGSDIDSNVKFAGAENTYNFTFADDVKVRSKFGVEASKKNFYFGVSAGYEWGSEGRSTTSINANMKYMF